MEARFSLYQDMKEAISKSLAQVKHVGLWNQDTFFLEQDAPWLRPAVFIEFCPISWDNVFKGYPMTVRGTGDVKLHVVTDWNDEQDYEQALTLSKEVANTLMYISDLDRGYAVCRPGQTLTNHDHENILENIEVLSVKWQQIYYDVEGLADA